MIVLISVPSVGLFAWTVHLFTAKRFTFRSPRVAALCSGISGTLVLTPTRVSDPWTEWIGTRTL